MIKIQRLLVIFISITIIASCKNEKKKPIKITQELFLGGWSIADKNPKDCKECPIIMFRYDGENYGWIRKSNQSEQKFIWRVKNELLKFNSVFEIIKKNDSIFDTISYTPYIKDGFYKVEYINPQEIDLLDTINNKRISLRK
jgi:hypothetical protein